MKTPQHIIALLQKHLDDLPLSEQEARTLQEWHASGGAGFFDLGDEDLEHLVSYNELLADESRLAASLQQFRARREQAGSVSVVRRVHFMRRWGWVAAAILIIAVGITTAIMVTSDQQSKSSGTSDLASASPEILPGSDKAILTLADGSTITLDSIASGAIAQQGNAAIIKLDNGEIRYDLNGAETGAVLMNTMSTPRGGQYHLTLPDGSRVWLNAASSITYPAAFAGNQRKVKVTGEVYLEIARNKAKPFLVDVDGQSTVQVLGTSFNINAYPDEGNITTTLIDGSVRIDAVTLKPGQQALQLLKSADRQVTISDANIEQTLAWKNGTFSLTGKSFGAIMKDVERWYDIQIVYKGATPGFRLRGKIDRGVPLSDLIGFLKEYGLTVEQKGRTLIIGEKVN